ITERLGSDGEVIVPLALDELPPLVERLKALGAQSVVVCLLHAYANPAHEEAVRRALEPHFDHVSVSSHVNAEVREYERPCRTVLTAAVMPLGAGSLDDLHGRWTAATSLHLLHSAGGMMSIAEARARPLAMAMSGPAAGVAAAAHVARALRLER